MAAENKTSTVTINAAFLQEIKEVNDGLWKTLSAASQLCSDPHRVHVKGRQVVDMLADLRDQLAMHFALEEAYGYFNNPIRVAPDLCEAARKLRNEHQSLYAAIRDLADEVDAWYRSGKLGERSPRLAARFREYCERVEQHERRENELILAVYDADLGVTD